MKNKKRGDSDNGYANSWGGELFKVDKQHDNGYTCQLDGGYMTCISACLWVS